MEPCLPWAVFRRRPLSYTPHSPSYFSSFVTMQLVSPARWSSPYKLSNLRYSSKFFFLSCNSKAFKCTAVLALRTLAHSRDRDLKLLLVVPSASVCASHTCACQRWSGGCPPHTPLACHTSRVCAGPLLCPPCPVVRCLTPPLSPHQLPPPRFTWLKSSSLDHIPHDPFQLLPQSRPHQNIHGITMKYFDHTPSSPQLPRLRPLQNIHVPPPPPRQK